MSVLVGKPAPDFEAAAVLADGSIVEDATPDDFFTSPRSERAKDFLGKILSH